MKQFLICARFRAVIVFVAAWSLCCNLLTILSLGFIPPSSEPEGWFIKWIMKGNNYPGPKE